MADFLSAIQKGVKNSSDVKRSLEEVDSVLADVSGAIQEYTKGKLKLLKVVYNESSARRYGDMGLDFATLESLRKHFVVDVKGLTPDRLPEKIEVPNALVLVHPTQRNSRRTVLAKWVQDPLGYPCVMTTFYGYEYVCGDRQELVSAFMSILQHPEFNDFVVKAQGHFGLQFNQGFGGRGGPRM
jgi:hypothetical protein